MKVQELLTQLKETEQYNNFKTENPEAFFCSAMFVLGDSDKVDLNFFLPKSSRISTFSMPFASITNHQEEIKEQKEIKELNLSPDVCDLKELIESKTGKKFTKIIAVLHDGNWNLTCLNGLDMSRISVNAYSGEIQKKDEGSLMDMVRFKKGNKNN